VLGRLLMVPFIFFAGYLLYPVVLSVWDVLFGLTAERDVIVSQLVFLLLGLAIGLPTLAAFLMRAFVTIDLDQGLVTSVRQFAVLRFATTCPLASIQYVRNTWEQDDNVSIYNVELVGTQGRKPILARVCKTRADSEAIARKLADMLAIPFKDETQEEPEADC